MSDSNGNGKGSRSRHDPAAFRRGWESLFGEVAQQRAHRPRIYISGPISLGCKKRNLAQALDAHRELLLAGFAPLNPMLTMLIPWESEVGHDEWIDADLPWVQQADAVLRLPGESSGADSEQAHAIKHGVPVFHTVGDLLTHFSGR